MTNNTNQNSEQVARDRIDRMLIAAEWVVQSKNMVDLSAGQGVTVREYLTDVGRPIMYYLSILKKAFEGKLLSEAEIAKCKQEADYEPAAKLLERIKNNKIK